jgi:hypothetical protein
MDFENIPIVIVVPGQEEDVDVGGEVNVSDKVSL